MINLSQKKSNCLFESNAKFISSTKAIQRSLHNSYRHQIRNTVQDIETKYKDMKYILFN